MGEVHALPQDVAGLAALAVPAQSGAEVDECFGAPEQGWGGAEGVGGVSEQLEAFLSAPDQPGDTQRGAGRAA